MRIFSYLYPCEKETLLQPFSLLRNSSGLTRTSLVITIALLAAIIVIALALTISIGSQGRKSSTQSSANNLGTITTIKELLGNFSQLKFNYVLNSSIPSQDTNASISYHMVGHPVINGTTLTEYDFVLSTYGASQSSSNSSFVYYNSQGNIALATINGDNLTGANTAFANFVFLPFNILLNFQQYFFGNSTVFSSFATSGSSTTESFGNLTMPVTTYHGTNKHYQGYVAHEFVPTGDPLVSLRQAVDLCDV